MRAPAFLGLALCTCLATSAFGQALPPVSEINEQGNNADHPEWGTPGQQLLRHSKPDYEDGISEPSGKNRPSARLITNTVSAEETPHLDERNLSAWIYGWGQFIDHDMDLTGGAVPAEPFDISVPLNDPFFDIHGTGKEVITLGRSEFDKTTGTSVLNPRQQFNEITSFIDGSVVYGSDKARADALRSHQGGKLKTSPGNLLPVNSTDFFTTPLGNANDAHVVPDTQLFAAGDVRANENIELISIQTLFMREHNRLCDKIAADQPNLKDDEIYQYARAIVRAEIQVITYREWLPALIGSGRMPQYRGYQRNVNSGIATEFSTAALRLGHTQLGADIEFFDDDANEVHDPVELRAAFFNPGPVKEAGIDPILKYLATDNARRVDTMVVDDVRNFLFGPPGAGGFDLAARNIQRGRDHGVAGYNKIRSAYFLPKARDIRQITRNRDLQAKLMQLYGSADNIDVWVGGLAEDHSRSSSVGPLFTLILAEQFRRLRDGDRFWYENVFAGAQLDELRHTKLSDIIKRNTTLTNLQDNVFFFDVSITGRIYLDSDRSAQQDAGERGVAGMTVTLVSEGEDVATTVTRRGGYYEFHDIHEPGEYSVRITPTAGTVTTINPLTARVSKGGEVKDMSFGVTTAPAIQAPTGPRGPIGHPWPLGPGKHHRLIKSFKPDPADAAPAADDPTTADGATTSNETLNRDATDVAQAQADDVSAQPDAGNDVGSDADGADHPRPHGHPDGPRGQDRS